MRSARRTSWPDASHVRFASTSPTRPARPTLLTFSLLTPVIFLSPRLPGVPNNPYGITGMLNVDRDDARVNYRRRKLEQLSVQQSVQWIQNARLKLASLLNYVRCAKSAFGDLNTKPTRLEFLRLYFPNAMFSSAKSVPLLRDTRPTSL